MTLLLVAGLLGCFKPWEELVQLDFTDVPFDSSLVASTDARIRTLETGLPCPDGTTARFYAVYRGEAEGPVPLALAFHSGAFDYELDPTATPDSPLYDATWRAQSRMSRDWADQMVWESLGMNPATVLASEDNQGALAAALVDRGVAQLWPGNCWADLWHNEEGFQDNDSALEGFSRNGRTFAWWMVRMAYEEGFADTQGVSLPFQASDELFLVGLGDGGRAVIELLTHEGLPSVKGALVDSVPDRLSPYLDPQNDLDQEAQGLARLWPTDESLAAIDEWSLHAIALAGSGPAPVPTGGGTGTGTGPTDTGSGPVDTGGEGPVDTGGGGPSDTGGGSAGGADGGGGLDGLGSFRLPERLALVWSAADPRQPQATTADTAAVLAEQPGTWVMDTRLRGHVFSNADSAAAGALVDYLLTGTPGTIDWQAGASTSADEESDTGAR
ncbi:hypothetical protein L6R53_29180 [Myxococcota bacterium]|nr:hypothetical protein [Myxococcota bacterium]